MIPKDAFPYFSVAAFSPENHYYKSGPSGACGQCFQIQCVNGRNGKNYCKTDAQGEPLSILVMISDVCPECEAEHMDVQSMAFGKLADQGLGNINMRYRRVECNIPKNIEVDVMNFGGGGQWLRLAITDTGGYASVQSVSVKSSSGSNWQTMDNTWGAVWESGSAPTAPLDFQITCSDGQIVTADSVVTQDGGISGGVGGAITFTTDVQFNIDDPAASSVQSFDGPDDPMVVTSTTPGNSDSTEGGSSTSSGSTTNSTSSSSANSSSTTSPAASSSSCSDTAAPGGYSCEQQKDWGKCDSELFTSNNYCAETCGRCGASSVSSPDASGSSPAASDSSCQDKTPSGGVSCQQRKDWGQCSQSWLSSGGYCQATCGTCGGSSSSSSSDESSPSPSPSSSSSGSDGSCSDNAPSGGTCAQQKQWGACDQSWMVSGNYCAATCGRCGSSSGSDNSGSSDSGSSSGSSDSSPSPSDGGNSGSSDSSPEVQSYSGPSGRRLLLL